MSLLRKLTDLIIYGNFWIGICAAGQVELSYWLMSGAFRFDKYTWFVGTSTIALYCVHRIVGIRKVSAFKDRGRFAIIAQYRRHIEIYGLLSGLAAVFFWWKLTSSTQLALLLPMAISAAYVIPMFPGGKRLRDLSYIKIFMVAITWSLLTAVIPGMEMISDGGQLLAVGVERALFLCAITLPFDIRDAQVDLATGVKSIAHELGTARTFRTAMIACVLSGITCAALMDSGVYNSRALVGLVLTTAATLLLITRAINRTHDYYFSGLLDGTLLIFPTVLGLQTALNV